MSSQIISTNIVLPSEYSITFNVNKEKDTVVQVTKAMDVQGRVYFRSGSRQLLFLPTSSGYRSYRIELNGMVVLESDQYYTEAHIEDETKEFAECVRKATAQRIGKAKHLSDMIIAGRTCSVYEVEVKLAVFSQKFTCAIDQQTNACLKWSMDADLNGFQITSPGGFICSDFQTANIAARIPVVSTCAGV